MSSISHPQVAAVAPVYHAPTKRNGRRPPVRVLAADHNPLFRDAMVRAIEHCPELEVVAEAADGPEALAYIESLHPDVAVIDVDIRDLDSETMLEAVAREQPSTRVILISTAVEADGAYRSLAAGAAGFIGKTADADQLCNAIAAAARGQTVLAPEVQTGLAIEIRLRARNDRPILSGREREILCLVAEGRTAPEIARELYLGIATVKTHLLHLYEKLGVSERAAAVATAMRRGLLE